MAEKESVLVYECISAGACPASTPDAVALLAQGVAMRDALVADLARLEHIEVTCVASRQAPLPAHLSSRVCRIVPGPAEAEDFLAREAGRHDGAWVIAPESGGLLERLAAAVGEARWLGCKQAAIQLAASKTATRRHLAGHGIPVPADWHPDRPEPVADDARWVVKPDDGAGSVDTWLHRDFASARADLVGRLRSGRSCTAEAWQEGAPLSLSLLCAGGRAELLSINRQRIAARAGAPVGYHGVEIAAEAVDSPAGKRLAGLAARLAAALPGLSGYVGVDVVWHPGRGPVVIEINPRLTCAYVGLSAALGRNLAGDILRARHPEAATHAAH